MNKNLNALPHYSSLSLSHCLPLSFSLCGLCLFQHPQSLRAQIDIGDLVINMWVVVVCVCVFFVSLCPCVCVRVHAAKSDRVLLSFVCTRCCVICVVKKMKMCLGVCVRVCASACMGVFPHTDSETQTGSLIR